MRLIDADRFYINYARRFSREPLKVEFFKQFIDAEPTVCDIDAIRHEIVQLLDKYEIKNFADADDYYMAILHVKEIIDKYTKGDTDV